MNNDRKLIFWTSSRMFSWENFLNVFLWYICEGQPVVNIVQAMQFSFKNLFSKSDFAEEVLNGKLFLLVQGNLWKQDAITLIRAQWNICDGAFLRK